MGRYKLVSVNDEATVCSVCGRQELKRVMWVRVDDGEPFAVGTSCGAKLLGIPHASILSSVKSYDSLANKRRYSLYINHPSWLKGQKCLTELDKLGLPWNERKAHPLFAEFHRLDKEAKDFSDSQVIEIELGER